MLRRESSSLSWGTKLKEHMSGILVIVTGLIYAYICVEQMFKGNSAMGMVYGGYAFANAGLYLAVK